MIFEKTFAGVVLDAVDVCHRFDEEEGGLILNRDKDYKFVHIDNMHSGSSHAIGLYEVSPEQFGKLVIPLMREGWKMFSSFHTHPPYSATPSNLDLGTLFKGFKHNVIYANEQRAFSYSRWCGETVATVYLKLDAIIKISKNGD
jgi:proteasome lid subunit RPN8/RPN11